MNDLVNKALKPMAPENDIQLISINDLEKENLIAVKDVAL